jgi:signal transduction histidine kinase
MVEKQIKILLVEDNPADAGLLKATLSAPGASRFEITQVDRLKEALSRLTSQPFDVLLLDLSLPDSTGLGTVASIQQTSKHIPIIVLTGNEDEQVGIDAVRQGVQDYLVKGLIPERVLVQAIDYAIERKRIDEELRAANEEMDQRVRQRTKDLQSTVEALHNEVNERLRVEEALKASHIQLRSMASELSLVEERERRSIALLLHDHIGQLLAMAKIKLGSVKKGSPDTMAKPIEDVRELIEEAISSTRSLTLQISPPMLYTLGLGPSLETICEKFKSDYNIACSFEDDEKPKILTDDFRAVLFRSVGELLANVAKHSNAKNVKVQLCRKNNHVEIKVQDDGTGFEPSELGKHPSTVMGFGLLSIRERLNHLGGTFSLESAPGKGTTVTITAPLPPETPATQK